MTNKPLVAVLLTTYNGEAYLQQQLESLFAQSYTNFKIYISDDNSSDSTLEILKSFYAKYPDRLTYRSNPQNIGVVKNFEKLLLECREPYIALSDQDDIWLPQKLQKQIDAMLELEKHHSDKPLLVHSDLRVVDNKLRVINDSYFKMRHYKLKEQKDLGHILGPSGIMGNTLLINQELKKRVLPFPDTLDVHDYWIGLQCELFGKRKTLFEPLVLYRIHQNNTSNSTARLTREKNFRKLLSRDKKLPNLETNRKIFLKELLSNVENEQDKKTLHAYLEYLQLKKSRLKLFYKLIKYSLIKRDFSTRIKIFLKILYTNEYK